MYYKCNSKFNGLLALVRLSDTFYLVVPIPANFFRVKGVRFLSWDCRDIFEDDTMYGQYMILRIRESTNTEYIFSQLAAIWCDIDGSESQLVYSIGCVVSWVIFHSHNPTERTNTIFWTSRFPCQQERNIKIKKKDFEQTLHSQN